MTARHAGGRGLLVLIIAAQVACSAGQRSGTGPRALPAEEPATKDLTGAAVSAPYDGPPPTGATTRTFVPWDSTAILEVPRDSEPWAGALIVRYGKSGIVHDGDASTVYLLEAAGPEIEPISIQWQPVRGVSLRAIARVDGALRQYDFDR